MQGILCGLGGRARSWIDVSNRKGIALAAFVEEKGALVVAATNGFKQRSKRLDYETNS